MAEQLSSALQALYHGSPEIKDQANHWLEQWQQSAEAWQVSLDVLAGGAGMEAQYFCAQTLRTKVQRDFEELPPSAAVGLRDSLLGLLVRHAKGAAPVRTQLSLAVTALAAHLPASEWGPGGVLAWLAQRLGGEPQDVSLPCMLELLTVLPQEASSYQPALRPERRRGMHDEMVAYTPQALQILSTCLPAPGPRTKEQVLEAFTSWLKLTGGQVLDGPGLTGSPLVRAALEGLRAADAFFPATEAVVELIYCTSRRGRPKDEMAQLVQLIVPEVMALRPRFHICLQQALAERAGHEYTGGGGEHEDSEETAKGMARLFAEVGEAYTGLIATGAPEVIPPVEALLDVASHPDDSICSMSFNFWHRLGRALTVGLHPEPLESEEGPLADEERARRVAIFTPILERLVALIRGRVRFPDAFDSWHRDERQEFKRARIAVGDTLIDCAMVLGGARMLQLLVEPLLALSAKQAAAATAAAAAGQAPPPFDWRTAEAALYCIRAVHRCAPLPGDALMMSLFGSLPDLPPQPQLQYTVSLAVGAYADWLSDTARQGEPGQALLNRLLAMLTRGLSEPEASSASALSIRRLCDGCAPLLGGNIDSLMGLYRQYDYDLDEEDVQQLIEAVALVASALPDGRRQACVQQMLDTVAQPLQAVLQAPPGPADGKDERLALVLPLMDRALVRLWPWIEAALARFGSDAPAVERICRAPRYAVRSAGKAAAPAVPLLVAALPARFEATLHPCFLYVASELIKTFGDEPGRDAQLGRALSYAPRIVMTPQLLPLLLDAALAGMLVQHREACCSILGFIAALAPRAQLTVRLLLAGVVGALPFGRQHELTDVLFAVLKVGNQNALQWVAGALGVIPEEAAAAADKQRFMAACQRVVQEGPGVNDFKPLLAAVDELSELCRRNRRAQAAAQRALLPPELHNLVP
eukprot:scaffold2.g6855.t1